MTWDKLKVILGVVTSLIMIFGVIYALSNYFAKTEDVEMAVNKLEENDELIHERVDISIIDDQIFHQEQQIYRIKDINAFERSEKPMTPFQKESLERQEKRLEDLEKKRERKIKMYEQRKE